MAIIYKKQPSKFVETDKKDPKKKPAGLGRSFDSLLEDNSPNAGAKPAVVRRNEADERRQRNDDLYKRKV